MSKHYLLLGAGFSRNWDGWLVSEIFDHLLTLEAMQQRPSLVALLKRHQRDGTGFEGALSAVQEAAARSSRTADDVMNLVVFQDAITSTFRLMNSMFFEKTGIDFSNSREASVRDFLARFDAIFTLNQDLLLEKHYVDVVNPGNPGVGLPGIQRPLNLSPHDHARWLSEPWIVGDTVPGAASWKNSQPVFKLHGSSNWRRSDGKDLVIMGGQKMKAIQESPVLTWYHDEFARRLAEPGARLMTIGYGFQDQHINAPIYQTKQLPIFIVDPLGTQIGLRPQDRRTDGVPVPNPMDSKNVVGISKRSLSSTFGSDKLERTKVMGFFQP